MVIVTPFQEKKKQRYLTWILILAALGVVFFALYKFLPKHISAPRVLPGKQPRININFDILKAPILTNEKDGLRSFEGIPSFDSEYAGRSDPFQPY